MGVRTITLSPVGPHPALLVKRGDSRLLVVGDLHIGWEVMLSHQGIHVPSQTNRMLERLLGVVREAKPTRLVFLGDVKHTVVGAEMEEWRDVPEFFEGLVNHVNQIEVVQGNHDGNLEPLTPNQVKIWPSTGIAVWKKFGLFHGHAWPAPELLECETLIMGHLHPAVAFTDALGFRLIKPVWVRAKCDPDKLAKGVLNSLNIKLKNGTLATTLLRDKFNVRLRVSNCIFVPPFNDFLGGRPINTKEGISDRRAGEPLGPLLRASAVNMDEAEVQLLDGTFLGQVKGLRAFA